MSSLENFKNRMKPQVERVKAAAISAGKAARKVPVRQTTEQAARVAARKVGDWPTSRVVGIAIALAVVLFLALNVISSNMLRSARADLTASNLFSLSDGTRNLLRKLEEPLHLRLFLSEELLQSAPQLAAYANRVKEMLSTYESLADGKITLEVIDPKPFSDDEDRAVGLGINKLRITGASQELFFGLAATNSTNGSDQIPVFSPDREAFLEYDLTRMIAELGQPKKPVIALFDGITMAGNPMMQQPEQQILAQLREFYSVQLVAGDVDKLPEGTRVVLVVHPRNLSDRTLYTIDQWVLGGGATMIFMDPFAETAPGLRPGMPAPNPRSDLDKLLTAWGVKFDNQKAVGDPDSAIRITREIGGRAVQAANLPWLSIGQKGMAKDDALFAQLSTIILTTAGAFQPVSEKTNLRPLMTASADAGFLPADEAANQQTDPRMMYTRLEKPQSNQPIILAGRLEGALKTAFPDGKPKELTATGEHRTDVTGTANVILVGDADMVMDRNWLRRRQVLGQEMAEAFANNGAFILNAIEQMIGGVALADLRGRGVSWRPFERIERLEQQAEAKNLERQQSLTTKLQATEARLSQISQQASKDGKFVSEESAKAVEQFRSELLTTRAELRNVQYELRRDVDSLKSWITLINVGLVPGLIGAFALAFALNRRRRPLPNRGG